MTLSGHLRSLGARVTAWHTAVLVLALAAYAVVVFLSLRRVMWAELDDRLHHEIETAEGLLQPYWTGDGPQAPPGTPLLDDDDFRWLQVWSENGRLLFETDVARASPLPLPAASADMAVSLEAARGVPMRVKDERGHIARHPVVVRVATSEVRLRSELAEVLAVMVAALLLCAGVAAYGGHRLGRRTLSPINRLVGAASGITAVDLATRLPVETPDDEVGQLAHAFNATLARLEASFAQMQRFTANASHELRTPLAALQSTGQVALIEAHTVADHRDAIGSMLEEAGYLSRLLDTLLLLARSDAGQVSLSLQQVDLFEVVRGVSAECRVLSEEKDQQVTLSGSSTPIAADPTVLRIALANVLHNAIRYSPAGGRIRISVSGSPDGAKVDVEDSGAGIPPEHLERIFERFYRVDAGRALAEGGVGLGLAMARWAVLAHGGTIRVRNNPGGGSTFSLSLPHRAAPPCT